MRLPFRKDYMEIAFHVIATVLILAGAMVLLFRLSDAKNVIFCTAGKILAVFAPLLWAFFWALLLEPLVDFLQRNYEACCTVGHRRRIKNRKMGTALAYLLVLSGLSLFGVLLVRRLCHLDLERILEQLRVYLEQLGEWLAWLHRKLAKCGILQEGEGLSAAWMERMTAWLEEKLLGFAGILPRLGNSLLDILLGGAAAFYFLMEKEKILERSNAFAYAFLGERVTNRCKATFHEIYTVFSGYLGGQFLDACIMAVLFMGTFWVVGLPQAVWLGLLSGFSNLIPYFGAVTAFLFAVFAGLLSGTPLKALYASILIILLQQVDSIFIIPKAVGKKVELHPMFVLLSLAIFGRLLGFWGLLLAVPLGALLKNQICRAYWKKKASQEKVVPPN